jgi:hypothetical protein
MEHSKDKIEGCSMSCCRIAQEPAVHAHLFLLSPVLSLAPPAPSAPASPKFGFAANSLSPDPPIPPPKSREAVR